MKKLSILKTIQLISTSIFAIICLVIVFFNEDVRITMATNPYINLVVCLLWALIAAIFIFLFLDFSFITKYKYDYYLLQESIFSDPLSKLPNRYSCDTIIEKYMDTQLPSTVGAIMIDLTNLFDINKANGRAKGNDLLKEFSNILMKSANTICFVGRNGGNKFLVFFEDETPKNMDLFLTSLEKSVAAHNENPDNLKIEYSFGKANNADEHKDNIIELIALSNSRIQK